MRKKIVSAFLIVALLASQHVFISMAEEGMDGQVLIAEEEEGVTETTLQEEQLEREVLPIEEVVENTLAAYTAQTTNPVEEIMDQGSYIDVNGKEMSWSLTTDGTLTFSGNGMVENLGNAFLYWSDVRKVVLEESIIGIGNYGLSSESSGGNYFKEVDIPESVVQIGEGAFSKCHGLERINLPNKITVINNDTFGFCESLVEVHLPDNLTEIGDDAFYGCINLEKINLPNGVIKIGGGAFLNCESLTRLIIPSSVSEIGGVAFSECDRLQEVTFQGDAPHHRNFGNYMLREPFDYVTVTAYYPSGNPTWTEEARMEIGSQLNWIAYGGLQILPEVTDNVYVIGGSDGATIACSGGFKDFVDVYMDDVLVDQENYTVAEGSTILTFASKYLNTLSVGMHKVTLNYTYGSIDTQLEILAYGSDSTDTGETGSSDGSEGSTGADATATRTSAVSEAKITKKSPQTGDENRALPWLLLCFATVCGGTAVLVRRKRTASSGKFI